MINRERCIQEIAYHLWEQEGQPEGQSERLWLAAEAQFEAEIAEGKGAGAPLGESSVKKPAVKQEAKGPTAKKPAGFADAKAPQSPSDEKSAPTAKAKATRPAGEKAQAAKTKTARPAHSGKRPASSK